MSRARQLQRFSTRHRHCPHRGGELKIIAAIDRLNEETLWVLHQPQTKERFLASGVEPVGSAPEEEFAIAFKAEASKLAEIFRKGGIGPETRK